MESCLQVCDCNISMFNTGVNGCSPLMEVTRKVILVPKFDSTGARNKILLTATLNQAYFDALINQTDDSKRWFPVPSLIDVDDKRADAVFQTLSDDRQIFIHNGVRTFSGMVWGKKGSPVLEKKINSARCSEMSAWMIDKKGNLIGGSTDATAIYPFDLDSESIMAQMVYATDKTVQGVKFSFNFDPDQLDGCSKMILASEVGGANLKALEGLRNVYATFSAITTAGFTVKLYTESMNPITPITVQGLVAADFVSSVGGATSKVRRTNNTAADVAVTVSEGTGTSAGTYAVTFGTGQTSADIIVVKPLKAGFDFSDVVANPITIP